jgi:hypothetical protein
MKYKTWWVILSFTLIVGIIIFSCSGPEEPTYGSKHPDPNPAGKSAAVIDSIVPDQGYWPDVDTVKIYGSGFDTTPEYNFVGFGDKAGTCVSVSPSMIEVVSPDFNGQTVDVRVAIK